MFFSVSFLRRKRLQENFDCVKVDSSLYCIKEKGKINAFRLSMDKFYKENIRDMDFYNYINFTDQIINKSKRFNYNNSYVDTSKFKKLYNGEEYNENRLVTLNLNNDLKLRYKYDFIKLENKELNPNKFISESKSKKEAKRIITPGGVLFDKYNDDIIVFDAYRIRRFSYRDMKVKISFLGNKDIPDYLPVLDSKPKKYKHKMIYIEWNCVNYFIVVI